MGPSNLNVSTVGTKAARIPTYKYSAFYILFHIWYFVPYNVIYLDLINNVPDPDTNITRTILQYIYKDKHYYTDCFIINNTHPKQPTDYKPFSEKLRKVSDTCKNP